MEAAEVADPGTKEFTYSELEAEDAMDGTVGGTGEDASLGASGSSGAGSRTTNTLTSIGQGAQAGTEHSNFKLKRDRV